MSYIYKYENKFNHNIYIGQTTDPKKRYREHKNAAYNLNNPDYKFTIHAAIRKYGLENFDFTILEECSSNIVNEREKYWIKKYDSYENGYNETLGGQDGGYNGKQVDIYDLDGNYIRSFNNAKEAALELQVSYSVIQQVLHQKRPTCKQIQAKYTEDNRIIGKFKSKQGGTIPIYQLNKNTKEVIKEWSSSAEAGRSLNIDASSITKCLKGKLKTCGGFAWRYK